MLLTKILDLLHESYLVMEREISLLKQVEKLQKNHEDSKFAEVSSTIQSKLTQKNQKIDLLKARVSTLEDNNNTLKKVS